jgi:hypothetical protein
LTASFSQPRTGEVSFNEGECKEIIKWFGIRKACGQESIGCSFCFKVRKDLWVLLVTGFTVIKIHMRIPSWPSILLLDLISPDSIALRR